MATKQETDRNAKAHQLEVKWRMSPTGDMSGQDDYAYYQLIRNEAGDAVAKKASLMASAGWKAEGGYGQAPGKYMYEKYYQAAKDEMVKSGAGRYENDKYVSNTKTDKAHAAAAEANAGKAYADTAPTTGNLMSEYSGNTPAAVKVKDGSGTDAGPVRKKKRTLLGGYFGSETVLGG